MASKKSGGGGGGGSGVAGLAENVAAQQRSEAGAGRKSSESIAKGNNKSSEKIAKGNNKSSEKINSETNQSHEKIATQQVGSNEKISANELAARAALQASQITSTEKISGNELGTQERISTAGNTSREQISSEGNASQERISTGGNESRERIAGLDRDAQLQTAREKIAEDARQFNADYGLRQQTLGADILKTGASLRGPENYFQGAAYARGVQDAGLSPFVAALRGGQAPSIAGGTATTGNPAPLTVGSMANALVGQSGVISNGQPTSGRSADSSLNFAGGTPATQFSEQGGGVPAVVGSDVTSGGSATAIEGPATGAAQQPLGLSNVLNPGNAQTDPYGRPLLGASDQANLDAISQTAQNGLANLPLGSLESLSPDELKAFNSGLSYLGRSADDEFSAYQRSRPGQGSALAA